MFYAYCLKKGRNTAETQRKDSCRVQRRCCDGSNVSKRFYKVSRWSVLTGRCSRVGWADQLKLIRDQIETLIENSQCSTTWEIANILQISKSIKLLVKMTNVSFSLQKKTYRIFGQPDSQTSESPCLIRVSSTVTDRPHWRCDLTKPDLHGTPAFTRHTSGTGRCCVT